MSATHPQPADGFPSRVLPSAGSTCRPLVQDRFANHRQLRAARRFVLGYGGPGLARAGRRLGLSAGYLSQLLQGTRRRRLRLSELRRLRAPYTSDDSAAASET